MLSRRTFLAGTCAFCATTRSGKAEDMRFGCSLPPDEFDKRFSQDSALQSGNSISNFGSGDPTFDQALAVTLLNLSNTFSVLPGFVFSDKVRLNAFASRNTALGRSDGSVVFGRTLFREIMSRRENPEVGVVAVCAHEFGHILQYKKDLRSKLIINGKVKRLELHADFLAGYFAGKRKLDSPGFPAAVFATTQYSFGDNNYGSPDHHGTQKERGDAVVAGFETAYRLRLGVDDAVETGIRYVQSINV